MSCGTGAVLVRFAVGCGSPKKPPPESAFVPNPPAIVARKAANSDSAGARPDTTRTTVPGTEAARPATSKAEPANSEPAKRESPEAPPPPPPPATPPVPAPAAAPENVQSDPSVFFEDDFARGARCAKRDNQRGFGWSEVQTGQARQRARGARSGQPVWVRAGVHLPGQSRTSADDAWAEQRFTLGQGRGSYRSARSSSASCLPHPVQLPCTATPKGPDNNKLLRLWDRDVQQVHGQGRHAHHAQARSRAGHAASWSVDYSTPKGTGNYGKWSVVIP